MDLLLKAKWGAPTHPIPMGTGLLMIKIKAGVGPIFPLPEMNALRASCPKAPGRSPL